MYDFVSIIDYSEMFRIVYEWSSLLAEWHWIDADLGNSSTSLEF